MHIWSKKNNLNPAQIVSIETHPVSRKKQSLFHFIYIGKKQERTDRLEEPSRFYRDGVHFLVTPY